MIKREREREKGRNRGRREEGKESNVGFVDTCFPLQISSTVSEITEILWDVFVVHGVETNQICH